MAEFNFKGLDHQLEALNSDAPEIFMGCGWAAGKTTTQGPWIIKKIFEVDYVPPDLNQGLIAANTYQQLINSTLTNLYEQWRAMGIIFKPDTLPKGNAAFKIQVAAHGQWRNILCASLRNDDALHGSEFGFGAIDEAWGAKKQAVDIAISRVRAEYQGSTQVLLTTTLDDQESWMYERYVLDLDRDPSMEYDQEVGPVTFVDPAGRVAVKPQRHVIYAPTWANLHNLAPGYYEKQLASLDERSKARFLDAKWVSLLSGLIYPQFQQTLHVSEMAEFDPSLPVYWSHDFNIGVDSEGNPKPMSSCLAQVKKGPRVDKRGNIVLGPDGRPLMRPELHVFDEIILDSSDTNDVVEAIKEKPWFTSVSKFIITGDASGRAKDTRSGTTDYKILKAAGYKRQQVPKANPQRKVRYNEVGAMLRASNGDVRFKLHPRCRTLKRGLESTRFKPGGDKELETRSQHVTTALGYLMCTKNLAKSSRGFEARDDIP